VNQSQASPVRQPTVLSFHLYARSKGFTLDCSGDAGAGITALFGPSGSGKTTTLHCIAGVARPDRGRIVLNGRPLFSSNDGTWVPPERRHVGYVFQDGALFPHMTVDANIRFGARLVPESSRRVEVAEVVRILRLGPLMGRRVAGLSGGEKQRVALARALAASPEILLLDEPMASLDAGLRGVVVAYLRRLRREVGIPMLYVSHSITETLALADRALLMRDGRITAFERPTRLLLERAAGFWHDSGGLENLLEGEVIEPGVGSEGSAGRVRVGDAVLTAAVGSRAAGDRVVVSIGASEIILATRRPEGLSARNIFPARLKGIDVESGRAYATVDTGIPLIVELTEGAVDELGLTADKEVFLVFKSSSVAVLDADLE
jgi:molybdate transport system ATP-binding protein